MAPLQRNPYKGNTPRCWVRLRFRTADGTDYERDLLADTGCPCAVILGEEDLDLMRRAKSEGVNSNFGRLLGGWLELAMPELGVTTTLLGFGSDRVLQAARSDSSDFAGLAGLPLLRMFEYGGDNVAFWVRKQVEAETK